MHASRTLSSRKRVVLIVAAAVPLSIVGGAAWAEPSTSDNYVPDTDSSVIVTPPPCTAGVPIVSYDIDEPGTETVDITWESPSGPSVTLTDQPLHGELTWPGTEVSPSGEITSFPGLEKVDETWVPSDHDAWAAGTVDIMFSTAEPEVVTVTYPGNPICDGSRGRPGQGSSPTPANANPGGTTPAPGGATPAGSHSQGNPQAAGKPGKTLPFTGADLALYGGIAFGVIALGIGGLLLARRGKSTS